VQTVAGVADSTPLIHLSATSDLHLLRRLYDEILVPPAVYDEVVTRGKTRPGMAEVLAGVGDWIRIQSPNRPLPESLRVEEELDAGEWQAISLAIETKAYALFLDDRGAVAFARSLGRY
jgi:predicted nucleic acid-binding protein